MRDGLLVEVANATAHDVVQLHYHYCTSSSHIMYTLMLSTTDTLYAVLDHKIATITAIHGGCTLVLLQQVQQRNYVSPT
jgi:hypothetical protein